MGIDEIQPEDELKLSVADLDEEAPFSQASLLDAVRQDYQEIAATKDVYIPLVGYKSSGLAVRYRLPESGKELDAVATKVFKQFTKQQRYERNIYTAIDTMIMLCMGLYVEHPDMAGVWVEFDPELQGNPITFNDGRLPEALGWEGIDTARAGVRKLFDGNDIVLLGHAEKLSRWLSDTSVDMSTEIWELGE